VTNTQYLKNWKLHPSRLKPKKNPKEPEPASELADRQPNKSIQILLKAESKVLNQVYLIKTFFPFPLEENLAKKRATH